MALIDAVKSSGVAADLIPVTPSVNPLAEPFQALYIGTAGDLVITTARGQTRTIPGVPVGFFPVAGTHVLPASTASNIFAVPA
ncbi:MAG: hypothetical protein K0Q69_4067 [Devosia sp.]|jgi:hypothetical protein|nr:hypothetical protein [Devosia sp.]